MGKVATANVSKHSSKEVLGVKPRRENERPTSTMSGSDVRKEVPKMEKECNGILLSVRNARGGSSRMS